MQVHATCIRRRGKCSRDEFGWLGQDDSFFEFGQILSKLQVDTVHRVWANSARRQGWAPGGAFGAEKRSPGKEKAARMEPATREEPV
jgi:hypothetical protein